MTLLIENLPGLSAVRTVLAILLVFFLPGGAITFALFPTHTFGLVERLLLAISTSVSIAIVGGLVLNLLPWGLQATSWAVLLTSTTLLAGLVAWARLRNQRRPDPIAGAALWSATRRLGADLRFTTWQTLLIALAVLVGSVAWSIARTPAPAQGLQGYTTLWLLPAEVGSQPGVRLGLRSSEFAPTKYRLEVKANDQLVHTWPVIELQPNAQWQERLTLSMQLAVNAVVEVNLYRLDQPGAVYRQVVLRPKPLENQ